MSEKQVSRKVKMALELGPLVLFFICYTIFKDKTYVIGGQSYSSFVLISGGFVAVFVASIIVLWRLSGRVSPMQIVSLVIVVFMGGLTVLLNDEHFFKMKPTLIYVFFAVALGVGLMRGKSYLKLVMDEALPMEPEGWMILTRRIAVFFAGLAVANEVVWRNFSTDIWVDFKVFGLTAAMFLFFMTQGRLLERYGIEEKAD